MHIRPGHLRTPVFLDTRVPCVGAVLNFVFPKLLSHDIAFLCTWLYALASS